MHLLLFGFFGLVSLTLFLLLRMVLGKELNSLYLLYCTSLGSVPRLSSSSVLDYVLGDPVLGITGSLKGLDSYECAQNLLNYKKNLGSVFTVKSLFGTPTVQVMDADALKHMKFSRAYSYIKTNLARSLLGPFVGYDGLLLADGNKHRRLRRAVSPSLHHESVALISSTLLEEADLLVERLEADSLVNPNDPLNLKKHIGIATFSAILRAFVHKSLVSDVRRAKLQNAYLQIFQDVTNLYKDAILQMFFWFLPPEWFSSERKAKDFVRKEADAMLSEAIELQEKQQQDKNVVRNGKDTSGESPSSMLEIILREAEGRDLSRKELADTMLSFLAAGQGTSAMATGWTLYRLAAHPEWQKRLRTELEGCDSWKNRDEHFQTRIKALDELPLLSRIVKEVLRMNPPVLSIMRVVAEKDVLAGYEIPAGAACTIPILAIHMDPQFWKKPQEFNPDRFLPKEEAARARMAYTPFSYGAHSCIGQRFAILEIKSMIAAIVTAMEIFIDPNQPEPKMRGAFAGHPEVSIFARTLKETK